jgi:putative ABC transport system ATP-binding protein
LPLELGGTASREARRRAADILKMVGMSHRRDHVPSTMSGGEQQRVAIARALVMRPALLLADEPTGNLDSARSHEIMDLLTGLNREQGITVLMVTHEPDMAAYAGRVIHFLDGRVAADGRPGQRGHA